MLPYQSASGSVAGDLFIELFGETFGAEKAGYLYSQYHFYDVYQSCSLPTHRSGSIRQRKNRPEIWPSVTVGRYMDAIKQPDAFMKRQIRSIKMAESLKAVE